MRFAKVSKAVVWFQLISGVGVVLAATATSGVRHIVKSKWAPSIVNPLTRLTQISQGLSTYLR